MCSSDLCLGSLPPEKSWTGNMKSRGSERRALARDTGYCIVCCTRIAMDGCVTCGYCSELRLARQERAYAKAKLGGKCPRHPSRNIVPNRASCEECLTYNRERKRHAKLVDRLYQIQHHREGGTPASPSGHPSPGTTQGRTPKGRE